MSTPLPLKGSQLCIPAHVSLWNLSSIPINPTTISTSIPQNDSHVSGLGNWANGVPIVWEENPRNKGAGVDKSGLGHVVFEVPCSGAPETDKG